MKQLIIGLLLLSMVGVASADDHYSTCGALYEQWQEYEKDGAGSSLHSGFFMGYITGWIDRDLVGSNQPIDYPMEYWDARILGTTEYWHSHGAQIIGNWLKEHPEEWHRPRGVCVLEALLEAYGWKE